MNRTCISILFLFVLAASAFAATDSGEPETASLVSSAAPSGSRAPGQLTTIFAANGGYAGNLFDIDPIADSIDFTAMDVNWSSAGEGLVVDVYYKKGTCMGYETDPGAWTSLGSGSGTTAGWDLPTFIDLGSHGVSFQGGETYGICVQASNYSSLSGYLCYTNGGPNVYANYDLSLTTYFGCADPPFSAAFYPRIWNGTIYYDAGPLTALIVKPDELSPWFGGTATFRLNGGPDLANRRYALFGTVSGTSPGTTLPGGLVLPINWDWFTTITLQLALAGHPVAFNFIGELDAGGFAEASMTLPGHCEFYDDLLANFAWTVGFPWEFVSNPVELLFTGAPNGHPWYLYDDGSSENALGWTAGGESVWCHYFHAGIGDTITRIESTFGQAGSTMGPPNGDPCYVYVWDDPTNDNDPVDAVLLGQGSGVIANTNTDTFNEYLLDAPVQVEQGFFVACHVWQDAGIYAAPMDESTPYSGEAWFLGGATFDPNNIAASYIFEMGSIGFPAYWLLRAYNH